VYHTVKGNFLIQINDYCFDGSCEGEENFNHDYEIFQDISLLYDKYKSHDVLAKAVIKHFGNGVLKLLNI